jgi:hypothetical protein
MVHNLKRVVLHSENISSISLNFPQPILLISLKSLMSCAVASLSLKQGYFSVPRKANYCSKLHTNSFIVYNLVKFVLCISLPIAATLFDTPIVPIRWLLDDVIKASIITRGRRTPSNTMATSYFRFRNVLRPTHVRASAILECVFVNWC